MGYPSIKSKAKGTDFKPVSAGVHFAICTKVIDLGIQEVSYKDGNKRQPKVRIEFEIPGERVEYKKDGVEVNRAATIGRTYTNSISAKSNLRPLLEAWRGKSFTKEEEEGFELTSVLGKCCQISVVHAESNGKTYGNISSIIGLSIEQKDAMKADKKKGKPESELVAYSTEFHDAAVFDKLPEWLQKTINERVKEEVAADPLAAKPAGDDEDFDDDIPF